MIDLRGSGTIPTHDLDPKFLAIPTKQWAAEFLFLLIFITIEFPIPDNNSRQSRMITSKLA
jgi:hypothetical protein